MMYRSNEVEYYIKNIDDAIICVFIFKLMSNITELNARKSHPLVSSNLIHSAKPFSQELIRKNTMGNKNFFLA